MSILALNISNESSISSNDENIGGLPFILKYLNIYIPYSVISAIGVVVGVIGMLRKYFFSKFNLSIKF